jgi:dienelactone hydrolase
MADLTLKEFDQLLDDIGVRHEVIMYPNSGHAQRPKRYKPEAAKDAWEQTKKFFAKNLY